MPDEKLEGLFCGILLDASRPRQGKHPEYAPGWIAGWSLQSGQDGDQITIQITIRMCDQTAPF
jgi:hypothetical protein